MGFNGSITTTTWVGENRSWIKHHKGHDTNKSITLNMALFTPATHFPDLVLKSGTALGIVTATGLYGPYSEAAGDGRTVLRGFLYNSEYVRDIAGKITTAMFREGIIVEAFLPLNHGLDALGKADLTSIWYE